MPEANPDIPSIPNGADVAVPLSFGPARPLVLLPVRLETRFIPTPPNGVELRVRVYPDRVHIDSHEPALTPDEQLWGRHFWEQTWRAAGDADRDRAAWQQLADRLDPPRAAWVARALQPLNPADRPASPLDPTQPLPIAPRLPDVEAKGESWTRAPETRVLPNQWVVLGYRDGQLLFNVRGRAIPEVVQTGPDPASTTSAPGDDQLDMDAGMRWLVDFDDAERIGMGIRVPLTTDHAVAGVDFLLVMGIRDSSGAVTAWGPTLARLLDAHHYTGGLAFVPPATPTNNTGDAPSGFSSADPGHEASYIAERGAAGAAAAGSNADVLGRALGFADPQVLGRLGHAGRQDQLDARHMNTALWQATWGYFLLQMLGVGATSESPLTDDDIAWARRHFIEYVRASGPLPLLRVGTQPYGILPTSSLTAWKPHAGQDGPPQGELALRDFLVKLRGVWRRDVAEVPFLGRTGDIARDLAEILSMDGQSSSYAMRHVMGRQTLEHFWVYMSAQFFFTGAGLSWQPQPRTAITTGQFNAWMTKQEELTGALLKTLGVSWRPRLARAAFSPQVRPLDGALVQTGPLQEPVTPNYIELLLSARSLDAIRHGTSGQPVAQTLLHMLLSHSMLLEYTAGAARLLINRGLLQPDQRREPELVDLPLGPPMLTVWRQMATRIAVQGVTDPVEVGHYLLGFDASGGPDLAREPQLQPLAEFRSSLDHLKTLTVARLEQLLTGTLDLCSHRLDAWVTSFATRRLAQMRTSDPTGILIGGYGWVTNLKAAPGQTVVPAPPGEQSPIVAAAQNPGFIHAPSLTQAATAAILRSGHVAHAGGESPNDLLAIDLSSERVRLAAWLLDGVRQGQPLGALLGYRFERRLQEAGQAQFIAYFRQLAPLVAGKRDAAPVPGVAVETVAASNVADGLVLHRKFLAALDLQRRIRPAPGSIGVLSLLFSPLTNKPPQEPLANARAVLEAELHALTDSVDAVSDALVAESVHQVVRGNPLRAAASLESIAGGDMPPPELEVVRTPRTGVAVTHRIVTLFSGEPKRAEGWPDPKGSFRATAEPFLDAWASTLLCSPARVRCFVRRLDPGSGATVDEQELRLDVLALSPLDYVYAVEGAAGQQAELEQRLLDAASRGPTAFPAGSILRLDGTRRPGWPTTDLGFDEFRELLRSVHRLVTGARGLDALDVTLPDRAVDPGVDAAELDARAGAAENALRTVAAELHRHLATPDTTDLDRVRTALLRAAGFGVSGATPRPPSGDGGVERRLLVEQAASVHRELAERIARLGTATAPGEDAGVEERRERAVVRLKMAFGKSFVVLGRFAAADAPALSQALAHSDRAQAGDPLASTTWLQRMSRVRDGAARLHATLGYAEALGTGDRVRLSIAQLPFDAEARWAGLPLGNGGLPGGRLALAVHAPHPVDTSQLLTGLLIDEWVDVVPNVTETTGIAFQYDQPNAAPPQTILLAVPPEIGVPWTIWSLQQVLLETLDLARVRAVDPDALDEVGHYLPAMYFAINTAGHTVSTDFSNVR